jgi:hypothetical protein
MCLFHSSIKYNASSSFLGNEYEIQSKRREGNHRNGKNKQNTTDDKIIPPVFNFVLAFY